MEKIVVANHDGLFGITEGKSYKVIKEYEDVYKLINDDGHQSYYFKERFDEVTQPIDAIRERFRDHLEEQSELDFASFRVGFMYGAGISDS